MFLPAIPAIFSLQLLLTVHMCNQADLPHDMQQLHCVPLVNWNSDADSQGCPDLQSLNLIRLHCGECETMSNYARLHRAARRNDVH